MPALVSVPPWLAMPNASSRSIHDPDSRVSRPARKRTAAGPVAPVPVTAADSARVSAAPMRRIVGMSSGYSPAVPRTPSVPNNRPMDLLGNADPHVRWLDAHDADPRRRDDADWQLIRARAEALGI